MCNVDVVCMTGSGSVKATFTETADAVGGKAGEHYVERYTIILPPSPL